MGDFEMQIVVEGSRQNVFCTSISFVGNSIFGIGIPYLSNIADVVRKNLPDSSF